MNKLELYSFHIGDKINLLSLESKIEYEMLKSAKEFRLYKISDTKYLYLKAFGSCVFLGVEKDECTKFCITVLSVKQERIDELPYETFHITVDAVAEMKVGFNQVTVPSLGDDVAHLIMLNLAQSVALENYQVKAGTLLTNTGKIARGLEKTGDINWPRRKLRKFIGKTMVLKNKIEENLYIFETPDLAWSNPNLSDLDEQLNQELEFVNRYRSLQNSLGVIKENLDLFRDILHHKHSSTLEWIIILLILIEIIQILIDKI